ncbi:pilus assembly protein [Lysobacter sp. A3-1-A15]|uniref:pilus assembly protein n=1 Tax=Novilysobacter viscosus TaxID=3098602 RepID=UPI002EDBB80C
MKSPAVKSPSRRKLPHLLNGVTLAFFATLLALPVQAALTVDNVPPQSGNGVLPNIRFILDDSGSMTWERMPQNGNRDSGGLANTIQNRSFAFNAIYYDPRITYQAWTTADGTRMTGGMSYDAAYADFSKVGGGTINLSDTGSCQWSRQNGQWFQVCGGVQTFYVPRDMSRTDSTYLNNAANFFRYQILQDLRVRRCDRVGTGWGNCSDATPTGRSPADERRNFAIWQSYHSTRMKVAKGGSADAFARLDGGKYRVGYDSIWNREEFNIPVDSSNGVFTGTNKSTWYARLFNAEGSGNTPLHGALQRAGQYFSDGSSGGPYGGLTDGDGNQYACRQNFSILTSDGYWNNFSGATDSGNSDNTQGELISKPEGSSYRYTPSTPYMDSNSNTLADMAMRFWKQDLRPDMDNIVPVSSANPAFWQHMVTFGISIGLRGTLDPDTDLPRLLAGDINWPNPMDAENQERIDDLWHAAVNGRGEFVAATDPAAFASGLEEALAKISERTSSSSNVAANSTTLSTNTKLFQARYIGGQWTGELQAFAVTSGGINENPPLWEASDGIPGYTTRDVFTHNGTSGASFPTTAQQTALAYGSNTGAAVANYLKGQRSGEQRFDGGVFRNRNSLLGDIIHSSPVYSADSNTIFVGANDGMLHAIDADTGAERFAYVPGSLDMARLRTLSQPSYPHYYFVDGPIVVSNKRQTPGKNILVGTLGRGGRGVYALDVTDPDSFGNADVEWDVSNIADLGHVTGEPFIAKLNNGRTGVVIGNGFNSDSDQAVLLVLDLADGSVIARIPTGGSLNNGLSAPRGWDQDASGTVDYVYAGDLQGNLWKFDLTATNSNSWGVALGTKTNPRPLFIATDDDNKRQPITGGVTIGIDPATYKQWVFFGTGKMIEPGDPADRSVQSMYGIIDDGDRVADRDTSLVERTTSAVGTIAGRTVRSFESSSVQMPADKDGWYIDFAPPAPGTAQGERIIGDPAVVANVLLFSSIIPDANPCLPGGEGFLNALNAFTGGSVPDHFFDVDGDGQYTDDEVGGNAVGSVNTGVGMPTDGLLIEKIIGVGGSGGNTGSVGVNNPAASGRVSWRELVTD